MRNVLLSFMATAFVGSAVAATPADDFGVKRFPVKPILSVDTEPVGYVGYGVRS